MDIKKLKKIIDDLKIEDDTIKNKKSIKDVKNIIKSIIDGKIFFKLANTESLTNFLKNKRYDDEDYIKILQESLFLKQYDSLTNEYSVPDILNVYNKIFTSLLNFVLENEIKNFESLNKEFTKEEDIKELESLILDANRHEKEWAYKLYVYKLKLKGLKEKLKKELKKTEATK